MQLQATSADGRMPAFSAGIEFDSQLARLETTIVLGLSSIDPAFMGLRVSGENEPSVRRRRRSGAWFRPPGYSRCRQSVCEEGRIERHCHDAFHP